MGPSTGGMYKTLNGISKWYISCALVLSFHYITLSNSSKQMSNHSNILALILAKAIMNIRKCSYETIRLYGSSFSVPRSRKTFLLSCVF